MKLTECGITSNVTMKNRLMSLEMLSGPDNTKRMEFSRQERLFSLEAKVYVERNSKCVKAPLSELHHWNVVGVVDSYWEYFCTHCEKYCRGLYKGYGE